MSSSSQENPETLPDNMRIVSTLLIAYCFDLCTHIFGGKGEENGHVFPALNI